MPYVRITLALLVLLASLNWPVPAHAQFAATAQIDALIQAMPLDQRVGQLFMVSLFGEELGSRGEAFLKEMMPGAVAMFSYNGTSPQAINQTVNAWQNAAIKTGSKIPLLVAVDQEGGPVTRLTYGFSQLPWGAALGAMPPEDAQIVGKIAGVELSAVGINMNLAPIADVRTDVDAFVAKRTLGNDPQRIGMAVSSYARGLREQGVIAVLKHFPGHGPAGDSHAALPVINLDRSRLNAVELAPFRIGIENGADVIMIGHLSYTALDPTPNLPASLSPIVINDVLRKQLGFNGVTMTDAMDMGAITENYTRPVAAVMAIRAGIDLISTGPHTPIGDQLAMKQAVIDAVKRGDIPASRIDEALRRVLTLKAKYGLLTAWTPLDPITATQRVKADDHAALIERIYQKTITVVQDGKHLLPLTGAPRKVVLVYPGVWPTIGRECSQYAKPAASLSYTLSPTRTEQAAARSLSHDADVMVIFTYEIRDYPQQALLVNNVPPEKTVVVALQDPYDLARGIQPAAYVTAFNAYLPAFRATCAVLYGKQPALGKWQP